MKNNDSISLTKKIVLTGALAALVIILGATSLGMIPLGAASVTILHIPVIIAACVAGLGSGVFVGASFGILSLILAATRPSGVLDPFFVNPLCSVLPRVLFAVVAWGIWKILNLIPRMPRMISAGISAFASTMIHTLMVIGCLYIFQLQGVKEAMGGMGYWALIGVVAPQAVLEATAATVITVAVYLGLFVSGKAKSKMSKIED